MRAQLPTDVRRAFLVGRLCAFGWAEGPPGKEDLLVLQVWIGIRGDMFPEARWL